MQLADSAGIFGAVAGILLPVPLYMQVKGCSQQT